MKSKRQKREEALERLIKSFPEDLTQITIKQQKEYTAIKKKLDAV